MQSDLSGYSQLLHKLSLQIPGVLYQFRYLPDGRTCLPYASQGLFDFFGIHPEEVQETADPIYRLVLPEDLPEFFQSIKISYESLCDWHYEFRIEMNRKIKWIRGVARPEKLEDQSVLWHGYIWDVTAQKEVEKELSDIRLKYQGYFDSAPEATFVTSLEGRYIDVNAAACKMTGYSHQELLSMHVFDIVEPEFRKTKKLKELLEQSVQTTGVYTEILGQRKTGEIYWFRLTSARLSDDKLITFCHDISERKEADKSLKQQLSFQKLLAGVSADFVQNETECMDEIINNTLAVIGCFFRADRTYIFRFNDSYTRMSNTHEWCASRVTSQIEDLQDFSIKEVPAWSSFILNKKSIQIPDIDNADFIGEYEKKLLQAQEIRALLTIPMVAGGKLLGFAGLDMVRKNREWTRREMDQLTILSEIISNALVRFQTELELKESNAELTQKKQELLKLNQSLERKIQEEVAKNRRLDQAMALQARHAALGEMIGNIAHQWRQPLNALNLAIYDIAEAFEFDELDKSYMNSSLEHINGIMQKMSGTLDSFKKYNTLAPDIRLINLKEAINGALAFLNSDFEHFEIKLERDTPPQLEVYAKSAELIQVFINILKNARDAFREQNIQEPLIRIKAYEKGYETYVEFFNKGESISEQVQSKIFDPYFSTKPEGEGLGLGLYISKNLLESNMSGRILFDNTAEGVLFTVILKNTLESGA